MLKQLLQLVLGEQIFIEVCNVDEEVVERDVQNFSHLNYYSSYLILVNFYASIIRISPRRLFWPGSWRSTCRWGGHYCLRGLRSSFCGCWIVLQACLILLLFASTNRRTAPVVAQLPRRSERTFQGWCQRNHWKSWWLLLAAFGNYRLWRKGQIL